MSAALSESDVNTLVAAVNKMVAEGVLQDRIPGLAKLVGNKPVTAEQIRALGAKNQLVGLMPQDAVGETGGKKQLTEQDIAELEARGELTRVSVPVPEPQLPEGFVKQLNLYSGTSERARSLRKTGIHEVWRWFLRQDPATGRYLVRVNDDKLMNAMAKHIMSAYAEHNLTPDRGTAERTPEREPDHTRSCQPINILPHKPHVYSPSHLCAMVAGSEEQAAAANKVEHRNELLRTAGRFAASPVQARKRANSALPANNNPVPVAVAVAVPEASAFAAVHRQHKRAASVEVEAARNTEHSGADVIVPDAGLLGADARATAAHGPLAITGNVHVEASNKNVTSGSSLEITGDLRVHGKLKVNGAITVVSNNSSSTTDDSSAVAATCW